MSSQQRLALIDATEPTVVCCTPTYALRLAEVAAGRSGTRPLSESPCAAVIVAGEPGGCIPRRASASRKLGRAGRRSVWPDRSWPGQLRMLGKSRRPASQRKRVHLRSPGPRDSRAGRRWAAWRARCDEPWQNRQSGSSLPDRRYRRSAIGALQLRQNVRAARGRNPGADRRYGEHSRRQRVLRQRWSRSFAGSMRSSNSERQSLKREPFVAWRSKSSSLRPTPIRRRRPRNWRDRSRGAQVETHAGGNRRGRHTAEVRDEGAAVCDTDLKRDGFQSWCLARR